MMDADEVIERVLRDENTTRWGPESTSKAIIRALGGAGYGIVKIVEVQ